MPMQEIVIMVVKERQIQLVGLGMYESVRSGIPMINADRKECPWLAPCRV